MVKVVPAVRAKHKQTGRLYSLYGMPFSFKAADYENVTIGYVLMDLRSGTTFGTVHATPEDAQAVADRENQRLEDCRRALKGAAR